MAYHQIDGGELGSDKKWLLNLEEIVAVEYESGTSTVVIKFARGETYCKCEDAAKAQTEFVQLRTALMG